MQVIALAITALRIVFDYSLIDELLAEFWMVFFTFFAKFALPQFIKVAGVFKLVEKFVSSQLL